MIRTTALSLLCVVQVVLPRRGLAQDTAAISGCYRFDRAYFAWVGRLPGKPDVITDSTRVLQLLARSTRHELVEGAVLDVRPIPFVVDSTTARRWLRPSNWTIQRANVIGVAWRNGLYGPVFQLAVLGDTLRGRVWFTTDVVGAEPPPQPAWAVRVACPAG